MSQNLPSSFINRMRSLPIPELGGFLAHSAMNINPESHVMKMGYAKRSLFKTIFGGIHCFRNMTANANAYIFNYYERIAINTLIKINTDISLPIDTSWVTEFHSGFWNTLITLYKNKFGQQNTSRLLFFIDFYRNLAFFENQDWVASISSGNSESKMLYVYLKIAEKFPNTDCCYILPSLLDSFQFDTILPEGLFPKFTTLYLLFTEDTKLNLAEHLQFISDSPEYKYSSVMNFFRYYPYTGLGVDIYSDSSKSLLKKYDKYFQDQELNP